MREKLPVIDFTGNNGSVRRCRRMMGALALPAFGAAVARDFPGCVFAIPYWRGGFIVADAFGCFN